MFSLFEILREKVVFYSHTNLNKLCLKYQSYPKSRKIDSFGLEICCYHSRSHQYQRPQDRYQSSLQLIRQTLPINREEMTSGEISTESLYFDLIG